MELALEFISECNLKNSDEPIIAMLSNKIGNKVFFTINLDVVKLKQNVMYHFIARFKHENNDKTAYLI